MPPRKRARVSAASTPLADSQPKTPVDTTTVATDAAEGSEGIANDPWTDDQESLLFKNLIRYKPTGMHKHFRMLSISNDLRSHGYASSSAHTRIPGIWAKLEQLYDLEALDERENMNTFAAQPDPLDPEEGDEIPEFELPYEDFGEIMWAKRFPPSDAERSSSPEIPELQFSKNDPAPPNMGTSSVMSDVEKDDTVQQESPAAKTKGRNPRAGGRASKGGKGTPAGRNSKAQSAVSESAEDEEDEEDEDQSESEDQSRQAKGGRNSRAARSTRRTRKR